MLIGPGTILIPTQRASRFRKAGQFRPEGDYFVAHARQKLALLRNSFGRFAAKEEGCQRSGNIPPDSEGKERK